MEGEWSYSAKEKRNRSLLPSGEICEGEVGSRAGKRDQKMTRTMCCTMRNLTMPPWEILPRTGSFILEWRCYRTRADSRSLSTSGRESHKDTMPIPFVS